MGELLSFSILESANWKMKVFGLLKCYRKETFGQCDLDFPPPEGDNNDYQLKDGEVDSLFKVV